MTVLDDDLRASQLLTSKADDLAETLAKFVLKELAWVRRLPKEDVKLFVRELLTLAVEAPGQVERIAQLLHDWRATAEAHADREAIEELLEPAEKDESIPFES